ncbi:hypothetical protein QIG09_23725 [Klebsiella pneumoniae]|nr:hypothetical protein [Klebsiella pneumoniae]
MQKRRRSSLKLTGSLPTESIILKINIMKKLKFTFKNAEGEELAGLLELPENPKAFALLAHCFTCGKDLKGAARISDKYSLLLGRWRHYIEPKRTHGLSVLAFFP